jgi:hypothetical protein
VLGRAERGGFAGGADGHQAVDAGFDLAFDQPAEPVGVERAVGTEGGGQCGVCACEHENRLSGWFE